jgi:hypothetical protein
MSLPRIIPRLVESIRLSGWNKLPNRRGARRSCRRPAAGYCFPRDCSIKRWSKSSLRSAAARATSCLRSALRKL